MGGNLRMQTSKRSRLTEATDQQTEEAGGFATIVGRKDTCNILLQSDILETEMEARDWEFVEGTLCTHLKFSLRKKCSILGRNIETVVVCS